MWKPGHLNVQTFSYEITEVKVAWRKRGQNIKDRYHLIFNLVSSAWALGDLWPLISSEFLCFGSVRAPYLWPMSDHSIHLFFHFSPLKGFNSSHNSQHTRLFIFRLCELGVLSGLACGVRTTAKTFFDNNLPYNLFSHMHRHITRQSTRTYNWDSSDYITTSSSTGWPSTPSFPTLCVTCSNWDPRPTVSSLKMSVPPRAEDTEREMRKEWWRTELRGREVQEKEENIWAAVLINTSNSEFISRSVGIMNFSLLISFQCLIRDGQRRQCLVVQWPERFGRLRYHTFLVHKTIIVLNASKRLLVLSCNSDDSVSCG